MEEPLEVRYVFMMLLAIADQAGDVIGTDVAIARRINMAVPEFKECVEVLMQPDPDSNSQEREGRRVVESEGSRGYHLVNYLAYRGLKTVEDRREYMRNYMAEKRKKESAVNPGKQDVNTCKQPLAELTHAEAEAKAEELPPNPQGVSTDEPDAEPPAPGESDEEKAEKARLKAERKELAKRQGGRIAAIMHRRPDSQWTEKELRAWKKLFPFVEEEIDLVSAYYAANWPPDRDHNILRHDLVTMLNNWPGEVDRARRQGTKPSSGSPPRRLPTARETMIG